MTPDGVAVCRALGVPRQEGPTSALFEAGFILTWGHRGDGALESTDRPGPTPDLPRDLPGLVSLF